MVSVILGDMIPAEARLSSLKVVVSTIATVEVLVTPTLNIQLTRALAISGFLEILAQF